MHRYVITAVINCDVGAYFAFMSFPGHLFYLFSYLQI